MNTTMDLNEELPEGNRDAIGIKLAKELEDIDDERVLWRARLDAREKMLEDYRQIIYHLASKLFKDYKISTVEGIDNDGNEFEIDRPKNRTLHHTNVWFEI